MATITHKPLFAWDQLDELGDLERLRLLIDFFPDERLMRVLNRERGNGRNDYPVRAIWNSILAGIVFQHPSIEALRRELRRNAQLRMMCGFSPATATSAVPPAWSYTRFFKRLLAHEDEIKAIFDNLVEQLRALLPDFGEALAIDGKAIESHANATPRDEPIKPADGRRDIDANIGIKQYSGRHKDGTPWEKITKWFGYKLHLIVDAKYELPVAFDVTKASPAEQPMAHELINQLEVKHPELLNDCELLLADKGYDDGKLIEKLWDEHHIKPVIDIRNCWQDGEQTKVVPGKRNAVYDFKGTVSCHCPKTGDVREMAFGGFEEDRGTLKYRCPAKQYGCQCAGASQCPIKGGVRIPLELDRRVFTPVARSSYTWERLYKMRSTVERVNGRLDVSFGFEHHFIRGLKKMRVRCGLALCVMLAMAVGRIHESQRELMRSLVKTAG